MRAPTSRCNILTPWCFNKGYILHSTRGFQFATWDSSKTVAQNSSCCSKYRIAPHDNHKPLYWDLLSLIRIQQQGLVNVLIEHYPHMGNIMPNKYLKVMFKIPKMGHLPHPEQCHVFVLGTTHKPWSISLQPIFSKQQLPGITTHQKESWNGLIFATFGKWKPVTHGTPRVSSEIPLTSLRGQLCLFLGGAFS